jgi:drug/metabolite transporter (DMT)-like permease
LLALWIVWGTTYLGIAVMGRSLPPLVGNSLRFLAASATLALILVALRGRRELRATRVQLRNMATMGVMIPAVGIGTVALAEQYVPTGIAALIVSAIPLWIVLLRLASRDRPSALTLVGVAVGLGGLAVMLLPGGTTAVTGTETDVVVWTLALTASTVSWAFFAWRSTRYDLPGNPLVTTTYQMAVAGLALGAVGLARGERIDPSTVEASAWLACAYLALASLIGYSAFMWLLRNAPVSLAATYAYVNPLVAVILAAVILGEALTRDVILGLTVVLGGVVLVVSGERGDRAVIARDEPA